MRVDKINTSEDAYRAFISDTFTSYDKVSKVLRLNYIPEALNIDLSDNKLLLDFFDRLTEFIATASEVAIIRYRYGMVGGIASSLKETGIYFKVTDEHVRNIIRKIQRRVKHKNNVLRVISRMHLETA